MKTLVGLLFVILNMTSAPLWAKDFYLTVRRDFGPQENPVIDVDYNKKDPLLIRVLRPKNLTAFIAAQMDLRRAWKAPRVEDNVANALIEGFNRTSLDLDWLRVSLNSDWRKGLKSELGGGRWSSAATGTLPRGPDKLISEASDFEPLQEFSIFPDEADAKGDFDVPGFYYGAEERFSTVPVRLHPLPVGFYVVQVIQGSSEGQVVLVINDLLAQMQQSSGRALLRLANREGKAVAGARLRVRNLQGKWVTEAKTDSRGVADLAEFQTQDSIVLIEDEKRGVAILDGEFFPTAVVFPDVYLYSDRPMYRAGDLVQFRGIVRHQESGWSRLWKRAEKQKVEVKLAPVTPDPEKPVTTPSQTLSLNEFGTFVGELKVPEGAAGVFRIVATVVDADHVSEIRVKDYVKPIFFVEISSKRETAQPGDEIEANVKVERYAGGVPSGVQYRYMLYRTRLSVPEWVEDAGMGESGSTTTYGFDGSEKASTSTPELLTSSEDLNFDEKGLAEIKVKVPEFQKGPYDYQYFLKVYAFDVDGNSAWGNKEFADVQSEIMTQVRATATLADQNQNVELWIRALKQSGGPSGKAEGKVVWTLRGYKTGAKEIGSESIRTDDNGRLKLKVPTAEPGELRAIVTLKDERGRPSTGEALLLVAPKENPNRIVDVADLVVLSRKDEYAVGEKAKALVLFPENWAGSGKDSGTVYVTVAGDRIYSHQALPHKGMAFWYELPIEAQYGTGVYVLFSYVDPAQGWVERRIRFKIPKSDRALQVQVKPESSTLNPGAKQKLTVKISDAQGKPLVAEFSVSVVDKAVLDLQPEFRPDLMEFFYPTQRLNLMTFLSSHFQGYGYGEKVARLYKPNLGWAAPKGNPPQELFEKDTAYWIGQVKTNEKGEAQVSFDLPPNQTTWIVSVVAVDPEGRFGEGKGKFQSKRTHAVLLAAPNAIRVGDAVDLRLTVISNEKAGKETAFGLNFQSSTAAEGAPTDVKGNVSSSLSPTFYHRVTFPAMPKERQTVLTAKLKVAGLDLRQDWRLKAMPGTLEFPEYVKPNGGTFNFKNQKSERIERAELVVAMGLSGSILPSLQWLVQYPHGCVEQLTNTTIPNFAVARFFEGKTAAKITAEQKNWLEQAKKNAATGLQLLKAYQNSDGSFGWFPGDGQGNAAITFFVLMSFASVPGDIPQTGASLWKALEFLNKTPPPPKSSQAITLAFLDAWMNGRSSYYRIPTEKEAQLRFHAEHVLQSGTPFQRALVLRTLNNYQQNLDTSLKAMQAKLAAAVEKDLNEALSSSTSQMGSWRPSTNEWEEYPGKWISSLSFSARALGEIGRFPKTLIAPLRNRLLQGFNGANFGSTFETSQTLLNLLWLFEIEAKDPVLQQVPALQVDGRSITLGKEQIKNIIGGFQLSLPLSDLKEGGHQVKVDTSGYARLALRKSAPLDQVTARADVATLTKDYFKVDEHGGGLSPVTNGKFQIGDLVYVRIRLSRGSTARGFWQSQYYAMKEFVPAGFTVVDQDSIYEASPFKLKLRDKKGSRRVIKPDGIQWYFFFEHGWSDRVEEVGFLMRANYSGLFVGGVTEFEDFYEDGVYSLSPGARFTIERR
jgi:hypothetical protein